MTEIDKLLEQALKYTTELGADQADGLISSQKGMTLSTRKGEQELIHAQSSEIGLRIICEGKQLCISTSDLKMDNLKEMISSAMETIKYLPSSPYVGLPDSSLAEKKPAQLDLELKDKATGQLDYEKLSTLAKDCEDYALSQPKISNSEGASASSGVSTTTIMNTQGFSHTRESSSYSLSISVVAQDENSPLTSKMENGYSYGLTRHFQDMKSPKEVALEAAKMASGKLNPKKINSMIAPIILERKVANALLEDFLDAINGISLTRSKTFLSDKMDQQIFPSHINIIDNPHLKRGLSSMLFDWEGVATQPINLIENGILKSWILDCATARELNLETNARASRGIASPPKPSTSNLYMNKGNKSLEDLTKSLERGLLITDLIGSSGTNQSTGDFSIGASGIMIEQGSLTHPVSEITISGNTLDFFKNIIPASDLELEKSTNSPSLLIDSATIGGV